MQKLTNPNGRILYEGPSMLDGAPIVVIATGFTEVSGNDKTGSMLQTWIMRADIPPHIAFKSAAGRSVCGDCKHSGTADDVCYVLWWQAPLAVWTCWHSGAGYAPATPEDFTDLALRMGSCGDPAAVPQWIWAPILGKVRKRTGYTHQWRDPRFAWLKDFVQASVDSITEAREAGAAGWHKFRVRQKGDTTYLPGEVHCPASEEKGHLTNCVTCSACDGTTGDRVIDAHGAKAANFTTPIPEQVTA